MSDLDKINSVFNAKINTVKTKEELQSIKTEFFGKNGQITLQFKSLGSLEPEKRKEFASNLNKIKDDITNQLEQKIFEIETNEINRKLKNEKVDVTLPIRPYRKGKIHPVSQVIDEISSIFSEIGFSVAEGPDVENEYNNFTALNTPEDHPARDMHDTFYLEKNKKLLLRTHTSPVQIRTMLNSKPPFKIIAPGRTYRCDSDQTHAPMFHQLEGLHIDKNINMGHLKGCLDYFIKEFFEVKNVKMRFRPSHFPFTEPSAEVDIGYRIENNKIIIGEGDKWLEILGCGMVHPNVLKNVKIDPKKFQGFAFGIGIDRLAMLKYGINDLRAFFEADYRWLSHFGFDPLDVPTNYRGLSK
jgi:phenylalanyl-tRNA synthetase alpha chain